MQHFMACTFNAYFDHAAEMVCNAEIHTTQYKVMASLLWYTSAECKLLIKLQFLYFSTCIANYHLNFNYC